MEKKEFQNYFFFFLKMWKLIYYDTYITHACKMLYVEYIFTLNILEVIEGLEIACPVKYMCHLKIQKCRVEAMCLMYCS